jgi:hypothetical protein
MNADGDEYGWAVTVGLWRIKHNLHRFLWRRINAFGKKQTSVTNL